MCGRVNQARPVADLAHLFDAEDRADLPPGRYNVAPTDPIAVVVERPERRVLAAFRWGLVPHWAQDAKGGARMINARAETLTRSPAFRFAFQHRRCLVPVDGFYEWLRSPGGRQPYYIRSLDGEPLVFAGLAASWHDPNPEVPTLRTCSIVTTTPNALLAPIHNRMPAILARADWEAWLDRDTSDLGRLQGMLGPYPAEELVAFPVSSRVSHVANNGPDLIVPLPAMT